MQNRIDQLSDQLKTAQRWLELSDRKVRTLIEAIPVGILIVGESLRIEGANPQCLVLLKCEYSDLIKRDLSTIFELSQCPELFGEDTWKTGTQQPRAVTVVRVNGEQFPAEILAKPFEVPSARKLLITLEDVSERHEMERMKKEFVSMVSHDLRTPLTSIQCFLSAVVEGAYDETMSSLKERADAVEHDTRRLITMINNLLDVDKLESGRLDMFFDVVLCTDIVQSSVQSISSLAEIRGIPLEIAEPQEALHVMADMDLTIQVFVNFLSNALKFSPRGEAVRIIIEPEEAHVKVLVCDKGPGIPEEFRKRMFNRFEQARVSDARVKGGSGLGLAISKAIIEQQGGSIGVDSEEGQGSTFWFTIPRVVV